jgi:uncharacterized DUF497 family protein
MKLHENFEWDPKKAKGNPKKHQGVTFDDAAAVLGDDQDDIYHEEEYDDAHSIREDRYITTGSHPDDRRIILKSAGPIVLRIRSRLPISSARYS